MTHEEKFVNELIGYIFAYPDGDYMTMECLCRKLHKHELIAKVNGHWQPLDKRCEECIFIEGTHWCNGCDKTPKSTEIVKDLVKDEPQTDYTPDCPFCKRYGTEDCLGSDCRHYKTYKTEPQTERSE